MDLILTIAVVVLFFKVFGLAERVRELEDARTGAPRAPLVPPRTEPVDVVSESAGMAQPAASVAPAIAEVPAQAVPESRPVVAPLAPPPPATPAAPSPLVLWFQDQPLIKVGALIFFLGAAWFVSYAITEGWISPLFRILIGFAVALTLYGVAYWRRSAAVAQFLVLTALGTGILFVTVFAAQFVFFLFAPAVALCILALAALYTLVVAVRHSAQWLAVCAVLAGYAAPLVTAAPEPNAVLLMTYLLCLTGAFLGVSLRQPWRVLTAVCVVAVACYTLAGGEVLVPFVLYAFTLAFTVLFTGSVVSNMLRSTAVHSLDVTNLIGALATYAYVAALVPVYDGLLMYVASLALAVLGYAVHVRYARSAVTAVLTASASAGLLLGTVYLLSGYMLLLALTIEIAAAAIVLLYLQLSPRAITVSLALFVLPLVGAIGLCFDPVWSTGAFHAVSFATGLLALALGVVTVYAHVAVARRDDAGLARVAYLFAYPSLAYVFTWLAVFGDAYESGDTTAGVFAYLAMAWVTLALLVASMHYRALRPLRGLAYGAMVVPLLLSMASFAAPHGVAGVLNRDAVGMYLMAALLALTALVSLAYYQHTGDRALRRGGGWYTVVAVGYVAIVVWIFFSARFVADPVAAYVGTYATYGLMVYALIGLIMLMRQPGAWLQYATMFGVFPLVLSLASMDVSRWEGGLVSVDAAGLYVMTTLLWVIGLRFLGAAKTRFAGEADMLGMSRIVLAAAFVYSTALVWLMATSAFSGTDVGVTVALFVYTVVGLTLYVFGSQQQRPALRYAGIALLTVVVVRLAVVDVWTMELLWRIGTFVGIGLLFMLAAVFEKQTHRVPEPSE